MAGRASGAGARPTEVDRTWATKRGDQAAPSSAGAGVVAGRAEREERFGDDVDGGDARHHPQELADIAQRLTPQADDLARLGAGNVGVADEDAPRGSKVVAVDHPHQRGLARAGTAGQRHAFPGRDAQRGTCHHRDLGAALIVQGETLADVLDIDHPISFAG